MPLRKEEGRGRNTVSPLSNPCYRLEKPTSWTGLDDWSTETILLKEIKKPSGVKSGRALGMKKKLVVFDFDGVVVDSTSLALRVFSKTWNAFGKKLPINSVKQFRVWYDSEWENNYLKSGFTREQIPKALKEEERHLDYSKTRIFRGMSKIIRDFSEKYELAIFSTTKKHHITGKLKQKGLEKFFKTIVGGDDSSEKRVKLAKAIKLVKATSRNTVVIGDTPSDIRAGKALGAKTIGVLYGWSTREKIYREKPDAIARKASDIPRLVEKLFNA